MSAVVRRVAAGDCAAAREGAAARDCAEGIRCAYCPA